MPFRIIKGTFHVVGYSPDGDSIRFKAKNPKLWDLLGGKSVERNNQGCAQLRIEGIDTLETHYNQKHQPIILANSATNYLLRLLKIKNVKWSVPRRKVISADDNVDGYILVRRTDTYNRPISFVFAGRCQYKDGQSIYLDTKNAKGSINYKMLLEGHAYPTFYDGMFHDLRDLFAKVTVKARSSRSNIWSKDKTNRYTLINSLNHITNQYILFPKLFRRLVDYIAINRNTSLNIKHFISYLEKKSIKILILDKKQLTHFDHVISVNETGKIKLSEKPENLVFYS